MPFEKDPNEVGALWENEKGHMSGTVNGEKVVCFRNRHKTSDKAPDWRVLKPQPRDAMATTPSTTTHNANVREVDDSEIPF